MKAYSQPEKSHGTAMLEATMPRLILAVALSCALSCLTEPRQKLDAGGLDTGTTETGDSNPSNVDADQDGYPADEDCDDNNPDIHPGAEEICNGMDDDCDGLTDDEDDSVDPSSQSDWYRDADSDGFGNESDQVSACEAPAWYVEDSGSGFDCDDTDPAYHPGAEESDCTDPNDYNCDGSVAYEDADADGFSACEDCNDADAEVNPDAVEICNKIDDDCDGAIDDDDESLDMETATWWFADGDADGFGDADTSTLLCEMPFGYVADDTDCDDSAAGTYPGADEYCDGVDTDCDGTEDEDDALDAPTWYADGDSDGYGVSTSTIVACAQPPGYVADGTDCDDTSNTTYPGATELCDGYDNDCNGVEDDTVLGSGTDCAAADCLEILADQPNATDGSYELISGTYDCDMTTDGGGWTEVGADVAVWGTSYDTTYYNSEGFSWEEVLFAYDSGSVHAHCTYPSSLTGCNNLGFQFSTGNWNGAKNWGSSVCGMTVTNTYVNSTSYIGGYDFVIDYSAATTTTIRLGTLEGISQCTIGDNPGAAYVDIRVR
jgi:hypothetical protein